ncbi:kinase-like protein [Peniophora sp. CONT]|nr:kinase-like protein [Peniophora sp. CONT]
MSNSSSSMPAGPKDGYPDFEPDTVVHGHYKIMDKLGAGNHASVWLAWDTAVAAWPLRAIKVLTASATSVELNPEDPSYELSVLHIIRDAVMRIPYDPGHQHIMQFLDHFSLDSLHGRHLALVINVLGHHLGEMQDHCPDLRVPPPVVGHICRQLLQALAFLHEECKVVHTDIKHDNVLLHDFGATNTSILKTSLSLVDFGEAVPEHGDHRKLIQPKSYRCPEAVAGLEWDAKADIWNLGCFVFELLVGRKLFVVRKDLDERGELLATENQSHFARIYAFIKLPHESEETFNQYYFSSGGARSSELFKPDGTLRYRYPAPEPVPLASILTHLGFDDPELLEFMQGMLRILPQDRLSARELLSKSWLHVDDDSSAQEDTSESENEDDDGEDDDGEDDDDEADDGEGEGEGEGEGDDSGGGDGEVSGLASKLELISTKAN